MTPPAEDPRSGEGEYAGHVGSCRIFYAERRCTCIGPAAGRGDTDSGERDLPDRTDSGRDMTRMYARGFVEDGDGPAARPAVDRAEPPEGLREALARTIALTSFVLVPDPEGGAYGTSAEPEDIADAVLALPAVAALLDAQAAVARVEAVLDRLPVQGPAGLQHRIRRALGGPL